MAAHASLRSLVALFSLAGLAGLAMTQGAKMPDGVSIAAWNVGPSDAPVRFRGISAISETVAWASGTKGTIVRTADGGRTWQTLPVPGADALDFRDIDAIDARTAYALSIGPGEASRIYKTADEGRTWTLVRKHGLSGFRSAVAYVPHAARPSLVAVGPSGADFSTDDGRSWQPLAVEGLHAVTVARNGGAGWGAGERGRIVRIDGLGAAK